ncbi:MAG TPA: NRDE family protein [Saprospiraceae bacterium]|nr:NRDE family protein [Saprospiraceae bacterium]HMU03802.1 NRDE family protein [Saprospiraceae bacterium]
MCCLTIYKTKDDRLVITHNRDEQQSRQFSSNQIVPSIVNGRKVWMPNDKKTLGTWIATDGQLVGALLNGYKENHIKKDVYKASRGTIIPALFQSQSTDSFINEFDADGFEPFTLLIVDKEKSLIEFGWDEQNVHIKYLDFVQPHIYSSSTLYSSDVRSQRELLYEDWVKNGCTENDLWYLHTLKGKNHGQFLNVDFSEEISTVSISQIILGSHRLFHYHSLTNIEKETIYL